MTNHRKGGGGGALLACAATCLALLGAAPADALAAEYQIYPVPHSVTYGESPWIMRQSANVLVEDGIDQATSDRLDEVLALKGIERRDAQEVVTGDDQLDVLVGIEGSGGPVDAYADELAATGALAYQGDLFQKNDAYLVASLPGEDGAADRILVLGRDTDSAFYGLTTVYQILQQVNGLELESFTVQDYADTKSRGFIEGYYGSPWSTQDRVNLMTWGGYYKLNTYVYAPKDDDLHRNDWRALYTDEQVENELKPQAEAGNRSKCRFVFALAPFHNEGAARGKQFRFDTEEHYQEDLVVLKAKYLQAIDAGVRQIAVLADDSTNWGDVYGNDETYVRLLRDLTDWIHELQQKVDENGDPVYEGMKDTILYCPALWSYTGAGEAWYAHFPENVQIVMTGGRTFGVASKDYADKFSASTGGRSPFMWINWPCSDMNRNASYQYLVMGGQNNFLKPGATYDTYDGIMLNPMQQSEPSKQGIFMAADYSWNLWEDEAAGQRSWEASFSYIDHNSAIETKGSRGLRDLSEQMRILYDNNLDGRHQDPEYDISNKWWINNESIDYTGELDVKDILTDVRAKLQNGSVAKADLESARMVYQMLQRAAANYRADAGDQALFAQVEPWISYWDDLSASALGYLDAAEQVLAGDKDAARTAYDAAKASFQASDTHTIADYYQKNKPARGGLVIVRPTVQALGSFVSSRLSGGTTPVQPSGVTVTTENVEAAAWHQNVDPKAVYDGDDSTFFWLQSRGGDHVVANASVTVTYAQARLAREFRFIQAETGGDAIETGKIEYQDADGTWVKVGDIKAEPKQVFTLDSAVTVKAVRVTNLQRVPKWWKIYDLSATEIEQTDPTDTQALAAAVERAEALDTAAWTASSRDALAVALSTAKGLIADDGALQADVDAAQRALEAAMEGVPRYEGMTLAELQDAHKSNDRGAYTAASYTVYEAAYQALHDALAASDDLSQARGEELVSALEAAEAGLSFDRTARDQARLAVKDAARYVEDDYTRATWADFSAALEALTSQIKADPDAKVDPATYDELRLALADAIAALEPRGPEPEVVTVTIKGEQVVDGVVALTEGDTAKLEGTVDPAGRELVWSVEDEGVATIGQDGELTAVAEGATLVTLTEPESGASATVRVTVAAKTPVTPDPDPDPEPTPDPDPEPGEDPDKKPDTGGDTKPEPDKPTTPGPQKPSGDKPVKGGDVSAKQLPRTGDLVITAVAVTGMAGIGAACAGAALRRRKTR